MSFLCSFQYWENYPKCLKWSLIHNKTKSYRHGYPILEREMFYLTTHSTHFIYGYMASDIWLRTILIVRKETHCRYIGYYFRLIARVPTERIAHITAFVTPVVEDWLEQEIAQWVHPMKDRSDDPSHHERTLYL